MKIAGIKLEDAGYLPKEEEKTEPAVEGKSKREKRYSTLFVDDREIPAIKNKDVKDKCILVALVNVRRRIDEIEMKDGKEEERTRMDFEILQAGFKPYEGSVDKDAEDMTDDEIDERLKPEKPKAT